MNHDLRGVAYGQSAPEISFDSTPDFFKLPDGIFFGEWRGIAVRIPRSTCSCCLEATPAARRTARAATQTAGSSNPPGKSYGKSAKRLCYGLDLSAAWPSALGPVNYNVWIADKGRTVVRFGCPRGPSPRVLGRKPRGSPDEQRGTRSSIRNHLGHLIARPMFRA